MQIVNMTKEEYNADTTGIRKSWLDIIHRSPAHLKHHLENEAICEPTPALICGDFVHSYVLEESVEGYAIKPKFDKRTTAGKKASEEWEKEYGHLKAISPDDLSIAKQIRSAVTLNESAKMLLSSGRPEVTCFHEDQDTGLLCKARADWLIDELNWIVDLKTTIDASPREFQKSIANYRYHVQAAHYLEAFQAEKFIIIAAEKSPPYGVAVYDLAMTVEHGKRHRAEDLSLWRHCKDNGDWPGYSDEIQDIELPKWALFA